MLKALLILSPLALAAVGVITSLSRERQLRRCEDCRSAQMARFWKQRADARRQYGRAASGAYED